MSRKHSKKTENNRSQLSLNKTYSTAKDEFGEIMTSPAQHDISFATTEIELTSDPLKYKLYVKKNIDKNDDPVSESIFASEIKTVSSPMSDTSVRPSMRDEGFSSQKESSVSQKETLTKEILRINNLENRITALETHIIDIGKEMGKMLEHQMNIIKAIDGLSTEIRNTKNQIAR